MKTSIEIGVAILAVALEIMAIEKAQAADLGMKDSPRSVMTTGCDCADKISWGGLSIGLAAGGVDANHDLSAGEEVPVGPETPATSIALGELNGLSSTGFLGHVTAGYDAEIGSSGVLIGVKGWYGLSNADTTLDIGSGPGSLNAKLEKQADYGGIVRLGRIVGSDRSTLFYIGGGWQQGDYDLSVSGKTSAQLEQAGINSSVTFSGPVAAAGVEYAFSQHIFGGVEYHHWFAESQNWTNANAAPLSVKDKLGENAFEATLRYKF